MPDPHATVPRGVVREIVENAIRDTARSGLHGYDELARGILEAFDKAGYEVVPGEWAKEASANDNA